MWKTTRLFCGVARLGGAWRESPIECHLCGSYCWPTPAWCRLGNGVVVVMSRLAVIGVASHTSPAVPAPATCLHAYTGCPRERTRNPHTVRTPRKCRACVPVRPVAGRSQSRCGVAVVHGGLVAAASVPCVSATARHTSSMAASHHVAAQRCRTADRARSCHVARRHIASGTLVNGVIGVFGQ